MRATTMGVLALVCGGAAATARAQQIPIRQVGPAEAVATERLFTFSSVVRPLADGRVIATQRKRVLLFSVDLSTFTVVLDSNAMGSGPLAGLGAAIIPALADSTYVVDMGSSGFLVIDPAGKVGRLIAAPSSRDVTALGIGIGTISTYVDPKGRLIYRGSFPRPPVAMSAAGRIELPMAPDTFPIVRADFELRSVDTLAVLKVPSGTRTSSVIEEGRSIRKMIRNPYPTVDAWTVLSDGTVAIVRGGDYHIDWVSPDGTEQSTGKMPFDWRRLTDDDKVRVVDSLKILDARMQAVQDSMMAARPPTAGARGATPSSTLQREIVPPKELPDYYPPVRDGGVRADADGNVWILPSTSLSARGGLLYDVVNRKGEVFERVQLPSGCALAGFAKGKVVYLICQSTSLERRRVVN